MTRRVLVVVVALVSCVSGCSRNAGFRCENPARYSDATEVAPLEIPDDLDPPSEAEALRVPATGSTEVAGASPQSGDAGETRQDSGCTEAPPDFFEEGVPG